MFGNPGTNGPLPTRLVAWVASITLSSMTLVGQALPAASQFRPPQNGPRPANREGAATRGGGSCRASTTPPLTTLVPRSTIGLTTSSYPAFYWYMPENNYKLASFTLYEVTLQQQQESPVYSAYFLINGKAGVAGLNLPQDSMMPPLKVGVDYRWKLELVCNPNQPSGNIFADGWIKRVEPKADLVAQLDVAQPHQRYQIYGESGYWYDALRELIMLRQASPQNADLAEAWKTLLESEAVQLNEISRQAENP